jgi:hypothetical protein
MTKIERIEQYLHEFFTYDIFEFNDFYRKFITRDLL